MSFFATPLGVKVGAALAGLGSVAAFGVAWLPHTVCLDNYKEFVQLYRHGLPCRLGPTLEQRAQRVLADASWLNDVKRRRVKFFFVSRVEPWFAGTTESGYGVLVGLPANFSYASTLDVRPQDYSLLAGRVGIEWISPAGRLLRESFVMSDEAQRFAMAHQLYMTSTNYVTLNSIVACGAALNTYILSKIANRKMGPVNFGTRGVVYSLVATLCYIGYLAIIDMATYKYERDAIRTVLHLGADYRRGGVEFYEKCIVRNKATRILLGKKGLSRFTVHGNVRTFFRTPHMPVTACLDYTRAVVKGIESRCDVCEEISGKSSSTKTPEQPATNTSDDNNNNDTNNNSNINKHTNSINENAAGLTSNTINA